jgi:hypothetical protein
MAQLRLKMCVESVNRMADMMGNIGSEQIILRAVSGPEGSPNAQWSKWTPSGTMTFTVNNPGAFGKVLPGQFYFVDLIETDKDGI